MKSPKRTTIYDIAKKLNLNASSVSRALSNQSNVSEATMRLILQTAKELNYKPNSMASNLRKGENKTIGVVVPLINQNFFSNVIAGIEEVTYQNGYSLVICQSNESYEREVKCIETLINQHVSCIIISVTADFQDDNHLKNIKNHQIQLIQFDRVADDLETFKVVNDNMQSAKDAVLHLIDQGYRRIALLEGPQNLNIFRQRKLGYLSALEIHDMPIIPELIIQNAWTKELSIEATKSLLDLPEPPDAIFASTSDFAALGVLEVAHERGISVPQDLGICGYSNEDFTQITNPSLTTIDQFSNKIGKTIADLFFEEMNAQEVKLDYKTEMIKPQLIIRGSTLRNKL